MRILTLILVVLSSSLCADEPVDKTNQGKPSAEGIKFFESKIRPVLAQKCYQCHSAKAKTAKKLQGKLLLDTRSGIRQGGESGPAVVPGDVGKSILISAIKHESFQMPPNTKLPKNVIDDFVRWVKMGAPDPRDGKSIVTQQRDIDVKSGKQFWSFQPLASSPIPKIRNTDWVKNDIDRFILEKLESQGIEPNRLASRLTLIRRLYFGIWGLPPTQVDVEQFLNDKSNDAYEKLVDRLLEGRHYGERWARHWLDLARFAESNGYAFDKDRGSAFHYRDFVIKALNEDMPYDDFVRLQLAGDQIAPLDYMAQAATGFLAAGPFTSQQTQKERERSRYEQLDDIVGTMGTAMLGLTIGCARCHDHKFDPIGHRDYYRLVANFAEVGFQDYAWDPDPKGTKKALADFEAAHKPYVEARAAYEKAALPLAFAAWEENESKNPPPAEKLGNWYQIGPFTGANYKAAFDKKFAPEKSIDLQKPIKTLEWQEKANYQDAKIYNTLTGANSANYLFRTIEVAQAMPLVVSLGCDDGIKVFLNQKQILAKPTMGGVAADQHKVTLNLKAGRNELLLKIVNAGGPSGFYFSSKSSQIPKNIKDILKLAATKRNAQQRQSLLTWFAPRDPEWVKLEKAEKDHLAKKPKPALIPIYAARKGGATYNFGANTRKVFFLARGNSNSKTGLATPAYLRVLMNSEQQENTWLISTSKSSITPKPTPKPPRVALADWITDAKSGAGHLLARVIVNRLWKHHFGVGIVSTPSDFGEQGSRPTHPELLDYLAIQLIKNDWRLKPIHKMIAMSATYQQTGDASKAGLKKDPDNLLWSRRPPLRLEAEIIRDNLLAVSGVIDLRMFGKGSVSNTDRRRSIYLTVKRGTLVPLLQLFDAPDAIQSIGDRGVTTVPPQALAMMNSAYVRQLAEELASKIETSGAKSSPEIIRAAYWRTLSRAPESAESAAMSSFIAAQSESYGQDANAKKKAIADFCHLMLCLNEFVYVD